MDVDENLLSFRNDDGFPIEPEHYIPIIPFVLVNGCEGIGNAYMYTIYMCIYV